MMNDNNLLLTNFDIEGLEEIYSKFSYYSFDGHGVPRVSEILKATIGKDYLIPWALKLGKRYDYVSEQTLYIGTIVHQMIDEFLQNGKIISNIDFRNETVYKRAHCAYNNFVRWYNNFIASGYKISVIDIEKPFACPLYGGTIDCIARITYPDGTIHNCIIDFKTSKKISFEYLIQTYAYLWANNWLLTNGLDHSAMLLDSIGIIRVDKYKDEYQTVLLDLNSEIEMKNVINNAFTSIINWFYNMNYIDFTLNKYISVGDYDGNNS